VPYQFTGAWTTHQLADFVAVVAACSDGEAALTLATERIAEAFDAEAVAILRPGCVLRTLGWANTADHEDEILTAASVGSQEMSVPGVGRCTVASYDHDGSARVLVARRDDDLFTSEEQGLLRNMCRVLALTLQNFGLIDSLRERQLLFERLSTIQRSISHRAELHDILDAITAGLSSLFDDEIAMIRLVDSEDPSRHVLASSYGIPDHVAAAVRVVAHTTGVGSEAMREGGLFVTTDYSSATAAIPAFVEFGVTALVAAPVHENGKVAGALLVGSREPGRTYTPDELEALLAFAEHTSLALTDANALAGMKRALHDPLTNLANRAMFNDRLAAAMAEPAHRDRLAVLFIDLDRFKAINDNLGHLAGDEVLVQVAERISASVRPADLVARLGGDEFTVLLEDSPDETDARAVAGRIMDALALPMQIMGREIVVTASVGIAVQSATALIEIDLVHAADVAMYDAKSAGRGRSQMFAPALGERARRRLDVETALRTALDRGDLTLKYQPLVDLQRTPRIAAVEALLRWEGNMGHWSIAETIDVAEDSGLIHRVGAWAINVACHQAAGWQAAGVLDGRPPTVHVNLSGHQLRDSAIVDSVATALHRSALEPRCLMLEITESVLIGNDMPSLEALRALRSLGVRLSLDDFGKGYSSLAYLTELDIQSLKIDQRFVQRLGEHSADVVVQHIIAMAQQLGMTVVGEGVETLEQMHRLRDMGCDFAQGFLFSPAITPEALIDNATQIIQIGVPPAVSFAE
jgi:diguanylate cyclase (GGDEF)-like protein